MKTAEATPKKESGNGRDVDGALAFHGRQRIAIADFIITVPSANWPAMPRASMHVRQKAAFDRITSSAVGDTT